MICPFESVNRPHERCHFPDTGQRREMLSCNGTQCAAKVRTRIMCSSLGRLWDFFGYRESNNDCNTMNINILIKSIFCRYPLVYPQN